MSTKTKWLSVAVAGLALVASSQAFAGETKVSTNGGFKIWHDGSNWVKFGGRLHLDQVFFMGEAKDKGNAFGNSGLIRRFRPKFSGSIGKNLSYVTEFSYNRGGTVDLYQALLSYQPSDHWWMSAGQLGPAYFGLENTRSSNATTFTEYNMQSNQWGPGSSFGLAWGYFRDGFSLNLTVSQLPDGGSTRDVANGGGADKVMYVARLAYAPMHTDTHVYHIGASALYRNLWHEQSGLGVSNVSASGNVMGSSKIGGDLIYTGDFRAKNLAIWEVDVAATVCSWNVQAQYLQATYGRRGSWQTENASSGTSGPSVSVNNTGKNVKFHGVWVETSYILTGETLTYGSDGGYFNGVTPESASGAWQIGARWDYLNLNDQELWGGAQRNLTVGVNYYYNSNMRMMLTYNRAKAKKSDTGILAGHVINDNVAGTSRTVTEDGDPKASTLSTLGFRIQLTY